LVTLWFLYQAFYGGWTYFRLLKEKEREIKKIEALKAQKIIYERRKEFLKSNEGAIELARKRLGLLFERSKNKR
jgi:hypothetical protein